MPTKLSMEKAVLLLLSAHSPNDVPPEPQRNVSMAAARGAVRPSKKKSLTLGTDFIPVGA